MGIELTDEELQTIGAYAAESLQASTIEYRRLVEQLKKLPTFNFDALKALMDRFLQGKQQNDGQAATGAAFCCVQYELGIRCGRKCIELIREGKATGEVLVQMMLFDSMVWRANGGLAVVLNGGTLAQSYIDEAIKQQAVARAIEAATTRHATTNEAKVWVQEQWRCHGHKPSYSGNKTEFARQYVELVKEQYGVEVTAKTIAEAWLSPTALN